MNSAQKLMLVFKLVSLLLLLHHSQRMALQAHWLASDLVPSLGQENLSVRLFIILPLLNTPTSEPFNLFSCHSFCPSLGIYVLLLL